jgi:hypothetical protein
VLVSYLGSGLTLLAVILSPWIVREEVILDPLAPHLRPGPLFWPFAVYFFAVVVFGAMNVNRARTRCLTATSRRRMAYLAMSFAAPALGVFPYMLLNTLSVTVPEVLLLGILLLGNVGVVVMIVVMAYTVAYFGAFTPDRVVKYGLIEYILRGPFLASLILVILITIPHVETFLGLPGDLVTLFAAGLTIILAQIAINLLRPFLNRLVYRTDLSEIAWLQELDKRLLMPSDLEQFLENVLSLLAELLRVRCAFVVTTNGEAFQLEAHCGEERAARDFLQHHDLAPVLQRCQRESEASPLFEDSLGGFLMHPLCTRNRDAVLGLLIVQRWKLAPDMDAEVRAAAQDLIEQAEIALEDSHLQQGIFVALQQIMPDIDRIQKRRQLMRYVSSMPRAIDESPVNDPAFSRWVKDALSHYWGGPKLTGSPLLNLSIVAQAREQCGGDAVRALRTVLEEAIEALRPLGEQQMLAVEWTLYNILDLKFRQGWRMSDIANRLAISESDLYRKQRAAIGEVARMLTQMEQQALASG